MIDTIRFGDEQRDWSAADFAKFVIVLDPGMQLRQCLSNLLAANGIDF